MFHKMTDEDWDMVIDVHLNGAYNVCRAAINHFREQQEGSFVLFTSTSGLIGNIGQANYAAAKMGVVGLSRIIAMEGLPKNVRSNIIAPFAWTRMIATIPVKDEASAKRVERMKNMMRADQVAQLAVGLASPACKDVSGQIFVARGNEMFLMSQPRPIRGIGKVEGWTPRNDRQSLHAGAETELPRSGRDDFGVRLGSDLITSTHSVVFCLRIRQGAAAFRLRCRAADGRIGELHLNDFDIRLKIDLHICYAIKRDHIRGEPRLARVDRR